MHSFTVGDYTFQIKAGAVRISVTATGAKVAHAMGAQAVKLVDDLRKHVAS